MTVLVLAGPTSAGKTEAALAVARRWGAVVVSADAMQVYRGLNIGTGKATPQERALVPHFGIDVVDPHEAFDASDFVALADAVCQAHPRVILAGGTSLYLRAFRRGLVKTPPVDAALRAELEEAPDLYARLERADPALAARLHPNDRLRLVRGLEVFLTSGERLSELQAAHAQAPDRVRTLGLWLDREDLYDRIDRRVLAMLEMGYVQEVEGLLAAGVHRGLKPMRSLGYRYLCDHLIDGLSLPEATRLTQRDTRRFSRKQRNWMRQLGLPKITHGHVDAAVALAFEAFGQP